MKTIKITTSDIKFATRDDWDNCPIARCLKRLRPGNAVEVFDEYISVNGNRYDHTEDTLFYALAWNEGSVKTSSLVVPENIAFK